MYIVRTVIVRAVLLGAKFCVVSWLFRPGSYCRFLIAYIRVLFVFGKIIVKTFKVPNLFFNRRKKARYRHTRLSLLNFALFIYQTCRIMLKIDPFPLFCVLLTQVHLLINQQNFDLYPILKTPGLLLLLVYQHLIFLIKLNFAMHLNPNYK